MASMRVGWIPPRALKLSEPALPTPSDRPLCQARSVRVTLMWASASTEVAAELCERLLVHLLNRQAVPIGPVDEVLRRSQISARGSGGVARFRQCVGKPVEQGSRRTITKCTNSSPAWVEVRRQHDVLLRWCLPDRERRHDYAERRRLQH